MRRRYSLVPSLAIAVLALAGCSAPTVESLPEPQATPSASAAAVTAEQMKPTPSAVKQFSKAELREWADEMLPLWMDDINEGWEDVVMDIHKPKDFLKWYPTDPHGHIESVTAPSYGVLLVTLEPYAWETDAESELAYVGSNMMLRIGKNEPDLQVITVVAEKGDHRYIATREMWQPMTA